jgi:undecaprenyl-diphosphatase
VLFAVSWAAAGGGGARRWEQSLAQFFYDWPGVLTPPLRLVMQAGTRGAVLAAVVLLALSGRRRAAAAAGVAGSGAWAVAVAVKHLVDRPRPTTATLGRAVRESVEGAGFPSSHAAIAAALAAAVVVGVRPRPAVGWTLAGAALLTAIARVHLGVHWPLDVAGGLTLGTAAGTLAGRGARGKPSR